MPTDKHRIAAYVPQAVYLSFEAFKQERLLNDSQAINAILTEFLAVNPDEAKREPLTIDKLRSELFDELANAVMDLRSELLSELLSELKSMSLPESVSESMSESKSDILLESDSEPDNDSPTSSSSESNSNLLSEPLSSAVEVEATEPSSDSLDGINDEQMAKLLTVDMGTVRRWKKGERKPSKANANLFDRWEVRDNLWYKLINKLGDNQNDG